jgi:ADP-ribose pyrophosphatase
MFWGDQLVAPFVFRRSFMTYRVVDSQFEFEGNLLRIRTDRVELQGGNIKQVEIVVHHGAVAIVPIDAEGNIWFVEQYRHPAEEILLEIPAGTLNPGEDPADCALRESREEIGMAPGELITLGAGYMAPGYSTEYLHFFLARDLSPSALDPDEDEELAIQKIHMQQAWRDAIEGKIRDVKTIAGLALARDFLNRSAS